MERSQKYDWFKGSSQKGDKRDYKKTAKTVWKFTKLFLIFFVLFISLWGCVQGFTLRQSNFVGQGTEFYLNESEIPPHISEWQQQEVDVNTVSGAAESIYIVNSTVNNVWLNREDDKNGGQILANVHTELAAQGVQSMADAYKGVNEASRIIDASGKPVGTEILTSDGSKTGTPIVYSTASTKTSHVTQDIFATDGFVNFDGFDTDKQAVNQTTFKYTPIDPANITAKDSYRFDFINALQTQNHTAPTSRWIVDAVTGTGLFDKASLTGYAVANNWDVTKLNAYSDSLFKIQDAARTIMSYLGYTFAIPNAGPIATLNESQVPGLSGTTYVPILTWDQAWTRGVGPFYGLAVFPISKFTTAVADAFPFIQGWETLLAMIIVIFTLRFLGFLVSFRSTLQQTKMQELNLKKAAIDAKYAPYKGNKQMMNRQRQEVSELYKKEGISPIGAFTSVLIVMPLFLAIWRVIGSTPHIKSTVWYGINFSETSWRKLFAGEVIYLPLMIIALLLSVGSQLFPNLLTRKRDKLRGNVHLRQAMKKNDKIRIIIIIITAGMSLIFSAGLQVYWIVVSIWAIIQAYATHEILKYRHRKVRRKVV